VKLENANIVKSRVVLVEAKTLGYYKLQESYGLAVLPPAITYSASFYSSSQE
jgi:hypothetical protein